MEEFIEQALTGQSFVVVLLTAAVYILWRSMQEKTNKLLEIIENNTRTHTEMKAVIEKNTITFENTFNKVLNQLEEHNSSIEHKLDFLISIKQNQNGNKS